MACNFYCCLLTQCEVLPTCCSGFPIATAYKRKLLLCDEQIQPPKRLVWICH